MVVAGVVLLVRRVQGGEEVCDELPAAAPRGGSVALLSSMWELQGRNSCGRPHEQTPVQYQSWVRNTTSKGSSASCDPVHGLSHKAQGACSFVALLAQGPGAAAVNVPPCMPTSHLSNLPPPSRVMASYVYCMSFWCAGEYPGRWSGSSLHSCRKRSMRALLWSGPCPS